MQRKEKTPIIIRPRAQVKKIKKANNLFHLSLSVMVKATPCSIVKRSLFYAPQKTFILILFFLLSLSNLFLSFICFLSGRVLIWTHTSVTQGKSCPWITSEVKCMFLEPSPTELEIFSCWSLFWVHFISSTNKIHIFFF